MHFKIVLFVLTQLIILSIRMNKMNITPNILKRHDTTKMMKKLYCYVKFQVMSLA